MILLSRVAAEPGPKCRPPGAGPMLLPGDQAQGSWKDLPRELSHQPPVPGRKLSFPLPSDPSLWENQCVLSVWDRLPLWFKSFKKARNSRGTVKEQS